MLKRILVSLVLLLGSALPLQAQEGHPLVGTWQGEWGAGNFLTLIMTWDGQKIVGTTNPGPTATDISSVVLDSKTWTVTVTTDLKDDAGKVTKFVLSGKLDNIGSPLRVLQGRWENGSDRGDMKLARQSGA